ncbi:MAG: hypothetical protein Q4Q07_07360 [Tissierellia bacterium]|nr:hypothetical protein [Tissierellia bacterium]
MKEFIYSIDLFFIYAFFGFIWETIWVSANKRKLVQRGFLHGPILPIYGFGAVAILSVTMPLKGHNIAIYFTGMIVATLLELVTGYVLEKLFHVRYWDYDERPFNYKGYICLRSSLFWGLLPIFLVNDVNMWIKDFLTRFPQNTLYVLTGASVFVFFVDVWISVQEAFEFKNILSYEKEVASYVKHFKTHLEEQKTERKEVFFQKLEDMIKRKEEFRQRKGKFKGELGTVLSHKVEEKIKREHEVYKQLENTLLSNIKNKELPLLSEKALYLTRRHYQRRLKRLKRGEARIRSVLKRNDITVR